MLKKQSICALICFGERSLVPTLLWRILSSENWIKFLTTITLMGIMVWEFEKGFAIKFRACPIAGCKEAHRFKHYNLRCSRHVLPELYKVCTRTNYAVAEG